MRSEKAIDVLKRLQDCANLIMLKPTSATDEFEAKLYFTGYSDLLFFVHNLMRLCLNEIRDKEDGISAGRNGYVDTARDSNFML